MGIAITSKMVQTEKKKKKQTKQLEKNIAYLGWELILKYDHCLSVQLLEEKSWMKCHYASQFFFLIVHFSSQFRFRCDFPESSWKGPDCRCYNIYFCSRSWRTWVEFLPWCCWNSHSNVVSFNAKPSLQFKTVPEIGYILKIIFHNREHVYRELQI